MLTQLYVSSLQWAIKNSSLSIKVLHTKSEPTHLFQETPEIMVTSLDYMQVFLYISKDKWQYQFYSHSYLCIKIDYSGPFY